MRNPRLPWIIYASSREVYGQQECLPVDEGANLFPINAYAWSKFEAENLVVEKRSDGLRAAIVRFSNVYGSVYDHSTRVIPAFAAAAAWGRGIRVDGCENTFDFTHVDDVVEGLAKLISLLESGGQPPRALHFVSGRATTLGALASFAVDIGSPGTHIVKAAARSFDVAQFCGDPTLAARLLSWRTKIDLEFGFRKLVHEFRASGSATPLGRIAESSQEAGV
jgi:nucleoside-diphosphate-sugar epimerase